jgi:FkbM family methyltransferase
MEILYGNKKYFDVTNICLYNLVKDGILTIPLGDHERAKYFGDPFQNIKKHVIVNYQNDTCFYKEDVICTYDLSNSELIKIPKYQILNKIDNNFKLMAIHNNLTMVGGNMLDEFPEQLMSTHFIKCTDKVLEIGSNIGRNTCVIASILEEQGNLITLESDNESCTLLQQNKELNNLSFNIENAALSYRKLYQKDWDTIPSEVDIEGYKLVNTITFEELQRKYQIIFDTLILDCEGAFYYILLDNDKILQNISKIIMENDYHNFEHKEYVDTIMLKYGFKNVFQQNGGWGPCEHCFYEVWIKQ